jgi:D-glucosaminate-6-phosphate ammonia-lyase
MAIYEELRVRRIINADARLTRLGGSVMPEPVLDAMREAARSHVDMHDLQSKVGDRIARLTNNEAAYVCTGASAGLFLSSLACMVGSDLKLIARLPQLDGVKNEIIIHRRHRIPYDPAIELAGAKLVEIGKAHQTFTWELESAINENTAAFMYIAGQHLSRGVLSLEETVEICHAHGVPVIVDAAAQLPPVENLWHYTRDVGADLAIFSGGKDLRGPQASGLIVGRAVLIEACRQNGAPHQRLGRPMKVGKEEMLGLLKAIELYMELDHEARGQQFEDTVSYWIESIGSAHSVSVDRVFPNEAGQPVPRALVQWDPEEIRMSGRDVQSVLLEGDPAIAVPVAGDHGIYITPDTIEPGDETIISERLRQVLQVVPSEQFVTG